MTFAVGFVPDGVMIGVRAHWSQMGPDPGMICWSVAAEVMLLLGGCFAASNDCDSLALPSMNPACTYHPSHCSIAPAGGLLQQTFPHCPSWSPSSPSTVFLRGPSAPGNPTKTHRSQPIVQPHQTSSPATQCLPTRAIWVTNDTPPRPRSPLLHHRPRIPLHASRAQHWPGLPCPRPHPHTAQVRPESRRAEISPNPAARPDSPS